jgi:hypothetical protein
MFPKSWRMISRGCGQVRLEGEVDPGGTRIRVVDLPVEEEEIELFVQGFRATFRGVLDLFDHAGDVEQLSFDRAARESRYRARWG